MHKKAIRKARIGAKVLRDQGLLGFTITGLQYIQKRASSKQSAPKAQIYTKARYEEVLLCDLSHQLAKWKGSNKKRLTFNILMPPPGKGSGGHMTLFRFISYLEGAGHKCNIYFHNPGPNSTVAEVRAIMGDSFPEVKARMEWLQPGKRMLPADGVFATSWETAYTVFAHRANSKHFYFVQDFEPYFYPVGSLAVLAENTYKFGFFGVTAGGWLAKKLRENYGMKTDNFGFGSGGDIYSYENKKERKEILFYARPYTERRGFELGIMALDVFHRKHPEYAINFLGWDVSAYDIPFPYNNLGILEHNELNELYNRCAAGLVLSLTNMSLLPLELLSSGCIPVVNDGENNRLVSNNPDIAYSANDPVSLAKTLTDIVEKSDLSTYSGEAAQRVQSESWDEAGKQFVKIIETQTREPEL